MVVEGRGYDVFISHCGKDSKRNFAVVLKTELERAGLPCFLDEGDLRLGDLAAKTMLAAMQTAKFGVVVLTEGFFRREWCLKELETFLERGNCIPVFMTPFEELRAVTEGCLSSRVWESFDKFGCTEEKYGGLVERAFGITGLRLEAKDGFWDLCFKELKNELLHRLGKLEGGVRISNPRQVLFDVEPHVEAIKVLMGLRAAPGMAVKDPGLAQEVGIVAVKGMGGVGKTTLAKRVYDDAEVRAFFGGRVCWLVVKQRPSLERICQLQKELLLKLGDVSEIYIGNPDMGQGEIRARLKGVKVLVCLDDVWAGMDAPVVFKEDLGPGSCILKTTRDANTIEPGGHRLDLDVLSPGTSKQLFCLKAFGGQEPSDESAALVNESLQFCAGLPLALEVLSSAVAKLLEGSDGRSDWQDFLAAMRGHATGDTSLGDQIEAVLRSGYDNLRPKEKDVFVLIAGMWSNVLESEFLLEKKRLIRNLASAIYGDKDVRL